jgi:hypothetical protein
LDGHLRLVRIDCNNETNLTVGQENAYIDR